MLLIKISILLNYCYFSFYRILNEYEVHNKSFKWEHLLTNPSSQSSNPNIPLHILSRVLSNRLHAGNLLKRNLKMAANVEAIR